MGKSLPRQQKRHSLADWLSQPKRLFKNKRIKTNWSNTMLDSLDKQYRLQPIMRECLPQAWLDDIYIGNLAQGKWHLMVADNATAYRLRFLSSEIEAKLAKKLPYPPKLHIIIEPALAQMRNPASKKSAPFKRRRLTNAQADALLSQWFDEMRKKHDKDRTSQSEA